MSLNNVATLIGESSRGQDSRAANLRQISFGSPSYRPRKFHSKEHRARERVSRPGSVFKPAETLSLPWMFFVRFAATMFNVASRLIFQPFGLKPRASAQPAL